MHLRATGAAVVVAVLFAASPALAYVTVGQGWDGPGQNPISLKYRFLNYTPDMTNSAQRAEITRAMDLWSTYADITWAEASQWGEDQCVGIVWAPDDGIGKVLAYAYYPSPPNSEPVAGDMYFDEYETWSADYALDPSLEKVNLFSVAVHELGHSLGVGHSADDEAIMFGSYAWGAYANALTPDDIAGIRSLYAPKYPSLSAHVWGSHTYRSDLIITVGVKDPDGGILWDTDVHLRAGRSLDDFDYDEIDLADAQEYFNGSNDWFVSVQDVAASNVGTLDGFTIRYDDGGEWTVLASSETGSLVDQGTYTAYIYDPIPEPTTIVLLAIGAVLLAGRKRRITN